MCRYWRKGGFVRRGWRCFRIIVVVFNVDFFEGVKRNYLVKVIDNIKSKSSDIKIVVYVVMFSVV